jgi:ABC-type nickel/cobalt efflux system permease component RcnA
MYRVCIECVRYNLKSVDVGLLGVVMLSLGLKMEAVCSSETLVSTYKSMQHYNPEDQCNIFTAMRTSKFCTVTMFVITGLLT